jgi:hypothetical protein
MLEIKGRHNIGPKVKIVDFEETGLVNKTNLILVLYSANQ